MLKKMYRLPIQSVIGKKGKAVKTPFFLIKIFLNQYLYCRFGVIISKKVAAKAVKRNKLRRIIFSACLSAPACAGKDFLIIVSPKINELKKEEIVVELRKALNLKFSRNSVETQ